MKTTILLLALSFIMVTFANAQNNQTKAKKTNAKVNVYSQDGFTRLVTNKPQIYNAKYVSYKQMETKRLNQGDRNPFSFRKVRFSARGIRICCIHPGKIEQYNPIKED